MEDESPSVVELKVALSNAMKFRFGWIFENVNLSLKAAALHPLHGHLPFLSSEMKSKVWESLEKECSLYYTDIPSHQWEHYHSMCKSSLKLVRTEFENLENHENWKKNQNFSALIWWRDQAYLNLLFPVVKMMLIIPATSAPTERLFSGAGHVQKRYNLNPENLEAYTLIRDYIHSSTYNFEEFMELIQEKMNSYVIEESN